MNEIKKKEYLKTIVEAKKMLFKHPNSDEVKAASIVLILEYIKHTMEEGK